MVLKVGVTGAVTVIWREAGVAHWPTVGEKLYVLVLASDVSIVVGAQVPVMARLLVELVGSTGGVLNWHSGPMALKVGVTLGLTVISKVMGGPVQPPATADTVMVPVWVVATLAAVKLRLLLLPDAGAPMAVLVLVPVKVAPNMLLV